MKKAFIALVTLLFSMFFVQANAAEIKASAVMIPFSVSYIAQNREDRKELEALPEHLAQVMNVNMVPMSQTKEFVAEYVHDNKLTDMLSKKDLTAIGEGLHADYVVYSQFFPENVKGASWFHTSVKYIGPFTLKIFSVKTGEYVYTGEVAVNGKMKEVSKAMRTLYTNTEKDVSNFTFAK